VKQSLGISADLPSFAIYLAVVVVVFGTLLLVVELRQRSARSTIAVAVSGVVAMLFCLVALLRPVSIRSHGSLVGPKIVVLLDRSRSMLLPASGNTRDQQADIALAALQRSSEGTRLSLLGFGEGVPVPMEKLALTPPTYGQSDLKQALDHVLHTAEEMPKAVVVIGDGRAYGIEANRASWMQSDAVGKTRVPLHTVLVTDREPRDLSLRNVRVASAAVAHQPLQLQIEVGCVGLTCDDAPITVRELLEGAPPILLASRVAHIQNGGANLTVSVTLDRAGPRLLEVATVASNEDEVPENNRRIFTVDVARERIRVLHVAGRPTYDVRALRMWLKSNASVDVIAFFILRSNQDNVMVADADKELALIQFPVNELFTEHLSSFDAVILQDFNAIPYGLSKYLNNLTSYVESGGGLVMVGGPEAFLGGGYDGTPLEKVLPVDLDGANSPAAFDLVDLVPRATAAGRVAPMLGALRSLFGDDLPSMPGANIVGAPKPGALVLWEHPSRHIADGRPMPLLTLGEAGDGRAVAIAVDGVHRLGFSEAAAQVAGRGHGALWDGLLGWLMRDPRFEPAQIDLIAPCLANEPTTLRVVPLPGMVGPISIDILPTDTSKAPAHYNQPLSGTGEHMEVPIGPLPSGGYIAKVRVGSTSTTRRVFACETGGDEWADSRPDEATMRALAQANNGTFHLASDAASIPLPPSTFVHTERSVSPILPPWVWTLGAASFLGLHWVLRRRGGLALPRRVEPSGKGVQQAYSIRCPSMCTDKPTGSSDSKRKYHPQRAHTSAVIANPRPRPRGSRSRATSDRKVRSPKRGKAAGGTPGPSSATVK